MAEGLSNLYVRKKANAIAYVPVTGGGGNDDDRYPPRSSRSGHGRFLASKFRQVWNHAKSKQEEITAVSYATRHGIYLEIVGQAGYELITKSLEDSRQGVRVCNIRDVEDSTGKITRKTTVYVPNDKKDFFLKKIDKYSEEDSGTEVVATIEDINLALVDALWTSDRSQMPENTAKWCEVWLMYEPRENADEIADEFIQICRERDVKYKEEKINFPERIILGIYANKPQLSELQWLSSRVAEYRVMTSPNSFYDTLTAREQREFIDNMVERLDTTNMSNSSVCLLDTGVNNGNNLLAPLLADSNMHTIDISKGVNDRADHGTRMAGLAAYFNLQDKLESNNIIEVNHFLESVKLLDNSKDNPPELYGSLTEDAINLARIENPNINRSICMAVTAPGNGMARDGRPSSWSGAIDSIIAGTSDATDVEQEPKLMFISAGNTTVHEIEAAGNVETAIINHSVEDPAQAWNAITVGAYTEKYFIPDEYSHEYHAVVEPGLYSPFTSTSLMWGKNWPIKPDIVLEGGNLAQSQSSKSYTELADLQSLTTAMNFEMGRPLDTISMTSAATAQAAWMGANIMHRYPELRPETVRALIIHSADWTETMKEKILPGKSPNKSDYRRLLKMCGYGVPDFSRAIESLENRVNLVIEDEIQPFVKKTNGSITAKEMHVHNIPWPDDILLSLSDEIVRMRVTLSYYIEPGPGEIGWQDKYRYQSCALSFDVNNPTEDYQNFTKRINKASREDEDDKGNVRNDSGRWMIGSDTRDVGSIHSDIWEGTASELSQSNLIAIFPKTGWWKTRSNLKKYESKIKYSLIVSIETPDVEVELYTAIKTKIDNEIETQGPIEIVTKVD